MTHISYLLICGTDEFLNVAGCSQKAIKFDFSKKNINEQV